MNFEINIGDDIEGNGRLVRTNNISELYNNRMKYKINIMHPRMAILVIFFSFTSFNKYYFMISWNF